MTTPALRKQEGKFEYLGHFYAVQFLLHEGYHYKVEFYLKDDQPIEKAEYHQAFKEHQATQEDNPGMYRAPADGVTGKKKLKTKDEDK